MRRLRSILGLFGAAVLAAHLFSTVAFAASVEDRLAAGGGATVAAVVDGDTVTLDDGRQVRLVGIQAPKLPLGRPGFSAWPLADEARRKVVELTLGKAVRLAYGGARQDRYGRALAHLFVGDGTWVQGEMLRAGLARVYTFADNRALAADMYVLEGAARDARRGIWNDPFYRIRDAGDVGRDVGTFQVVEGRVFRAARVRSRVFLNFAEDWKHDFTILVAATLLPTFETAGVDLLGLAGRRVRVRGWVKEWNGPMIEATHPEQIELPASP